MGCMSLSVTAVPTHNVSISKSNKNGCALTASAMNGIELREKNKNSVTEISVSHQPCDVLISIGLVCQISVGIHEVLFVNEGPLIVDEGYVKVLKAWD